MEVWMVEVCFKECFLVGFPGFTADEGSEPISLQVVSLQYEQQSRWTGVSQAQETVSQDGLSSQVSASVLGRVQGSQARQALLHLILWVVCPRVVLGGQLDLRGLTLLPVVKAIHSVQRNSAGAGTTSIVQRQRHSLKILSWWVVLPGIYRDGNYFAEL